MAYTGPITTTEITTALRSLKNGKTTGIDNIPREALNEGGTVTVDQLHHHAKSHLDKRGYPRRMKEGYSSEGITLLSIRSKVITRFILERMKESIDQKLLDEQAGFKKERSFTDQIAILTVIVEQAMEFQTPLYVTSTCKTTHLTLNSQRS